MNVEHELQSGVFDTLAQALHPVDILADIVVRHPGVGAVALIRRLLRRIDEETHAHGVHTFVLEIRDDVGDALSAVRVIGCPRFLIFRQHGDVATDIFLGRCRCAEKKHE